jgi:hypothetical protein
VTIITNQFNGARLKIERANKHIADLQDTFEAFVKQHPHTLHIDNNASNGLIAVEVRFRESLPVSLALIIGDAVHNLRTALDHANWELRGLDGGTQGRSTKLPTGDNQASYEASCKGIQTPRSDTKDFFISLAVYKGGAGDALYALHLLDNADKHTVLVPVAGICSIPLVKVVQSNGVIACMLRNCGVAMEPDGRVRFMGVTGHGLSVEFDQDAVAIDIFFGEVDGFRFNPVIPTLIKLADTVTDTIGQFEVFVRNRK